MGFVTIDGQQVEIAGERNLLEMVRKTGIDLPTFCYHEELSIYGACRMCVVETSRGQVISACSNPPADGMDIKTNTPRLQRIRRMMLELILARHDRECTSCAKSGKCRLQELSKRFGVEEIRFPSESKGAVIDNSSVSVKRDENKCILCGDCVRTCQEIQGIGAIGFANRGAKARVMCAFDQGLAETDCINCGQCIASCPTGALTSPSQIQKVWNALRDPSKHVVVSVAPAVRVAIGEEFGAPLGTVSTGRMVAAMKRLGFQEVFDTNFTADLTTTEEGNEFLVRYTKKENLPLFTSCCPAWVKGCETLYPELRKNLSTCRSPQGMYGSIMKNYYANVLGIDRKDLFVVSVMPCVAKKFEANRSELGKDGDQDINAVITTAELANMIKSAGIVWDELQEAEFDQPYGIGSGAGTIFGYTGGVATAVVRDVKLALAGVRDHDLALDPVEGFPGLMKADIPLPNDLGTVHLGVVSGFATVRKVVEAIKDGTLNFDIVEVMACPGGCVGGGGQPLPNTMFERKARTAGTHKDDEALEIRLAKDNPAVKKLYEDWLGEVNGHVAHENVHTEYFERERETDLIQKMAN